MVNRILELHGHHVITIEGAYEELFRLQAAGEVDVLVSAWLPNSHGRFLAPYREQVRVLTPHYRPYCIWAVPSYVPEDQVAQVSDLIRPDVLAKMTRFVDGINIGAGISRFSIQVIDKYGLGARGYQFVPGDEQSFTARVDRGIVQREWFVIPLWRPHYLNRLYELRSLSEPKGLLGSVDAACPVICSAALRRIQPAALDYLASLDFGISGVEELDALINVDGLTPRAAADHYLTTNRS